MKTGAAAIENSVTRNSTPKYILKRTEEKSPDKNLYMNVENSIIHNSKKGGNNPNAHLLLKG